MKLSSIVKESKTVTRGSFVKIVENTIDLLRGENGRIGNIAISERLVKLEPSGEALVISDLHGDLKSLLHILDNSHFTQKMTKHKDALMILLGDYGDRGAHSAEVYYTILRIKLAFPEQVVLLRGNHEGPGEFLASPHDLPVQFQVRFKENWKSAYSAVHKLFAFLYNAVLVEDRYLMVHGGLPPTVTNVQDLANANKTRPEREFLEDLLWSDPTEALQNYAPSPRGAGKLFGKNLTEKVLQKLGVKILIRGHEPCQQGFKLNHDNKVLTLFSRKGAPYFNAYGAYLHLRLSDKFESAQQLVPYIHKF